ncbi:uncharacterized protein [Euwallacea fornicatus]|uniref:uncharacterized protein isoform X2 n=1 Tax=Euwallacea fornicatus TaxID=995702 RepID=UPI00338E250C
MNKNSEKKGVRYLINWETQPQNLVKNICSLMEHQNLVDVLVCCGNNSIQAHKFVLAANSPLFREEFEKNPSIQQVIINGCNFAVLKSVVEIMYCGQTIINDDNVKFLVAIVKLFQMRHLDSIFNDYTRASDDIYLPKPQFLTSKTKYPSFSSTQTNLNQLSSGKTQSAAIAASVASPPTIQSTFTSNGSQVAVVTLPALSHPTGSDLKALDFNVPLTEPVAPLSFKAYQRGKRTLKQQAEQACVKEAQASRLALACLQKEIAAAPQVNTFIIEDTCTETTVENFIPHADTVSYPEDLNYDNLMDQNLENVMFLPVPVSQTSNDTSGLITRMPKQENQLEKLTFTCDKLKYILGANMSSHVEIMYKDAEGKFLPANEEILQSLFNKESLQYQVVDKEGRVSDLQDINKIDNFLHATSGDLMEVTKPIFEDNLCSMISNTGQITAIPNLANCSNSTMKLPILEEDKPELEGERKFLSDTFVPDITSPEVHNEVTLVQDD